MDRKHNSALVANARELRKNMTREEKHLWYDFLRNYSVKFERQKILGKYIADFYSAKAKLVIELDGSQHFEEAALSYDLKRTEYLEQYGLRVIRVTNNEIRQNFRNVCEYIDHVVKQSLSLLSSPKANL